MVVCICKVSVYRCQDWVQMSQQQAFIQASISKMTSKSVYFFVSIVALK